MEFREKLTQFFKTYQQKIALTIGYVLVATLGFGLGRVGSHTLDTPKIEIVEQFSAPQVHNSENPGSVQSAVVESAEKQGSGVLDCAGKIKGNIGSSGLIYHMPGGSFYQRTNPEMCFDTETEAQTAGFRRSLR